MGHEDPQNLCKEEGSAHLQASCSSGELGDRHRSLRRSWAS